MSIASRSLEIATQYHSARTLSTNKIFIIVLIRSVLPLQCQGTTIRAITFCSSIKGYYERQITKSDQSSGLEGESVCIVSQNHEQKETKDNRKGHFGWRNAHALN